MQRIGLTGGMGMGKSAVAEILVRLGLPVVDSDVLARQVVEPGEPALDEIKSSFGAEVIGPEGRLRRDALARLVFPDPAARLKLEAILHPRIRAHWLDQLAKCEEAGRPCAVVVIPLLFETQAEAHFNCTICVFCLPTTQHERLRARGWTNTQIQERIQAQSPIEEKVQRSDFAIWTEGSLETTEQQLRRVLGL